MVPFWGPGDATSFSEEKNYSTQPDMKIQLAAKFEKNLMDGYPALVLTDERMNERTDGTDNYSPFPTKARGLTTKINFN